MKKISNFIKNNLLISIFVVVLLAIIFIVFITLIRKGTFSLDNTNEVVIECPSPVLSPSEVECDITLRYNNNYVGSNKILSVNANYELPNGVGYVSYLSNCSDCDIDEYTENGFAIAKVNGLQNNWTFGKVTLSIPDDVEFGTEYTIGLENIEFSDSNYEMISVDNSSTTIVVDDGTLSYEFSSQNYLYNSENNYIYTKTDTGNLILSKLDSLNNGFTYNINNNKLEIKNTRNMVIKSIDIVNFSINDLTIADSNILISQAMTIDNVLAKFSSNGLTLKIFDVNNNERATNETIQNGDKLNIYRLNDIVDTYTFSAGYLQFDSEINHDDTSGYIYNLPYNTNYSYLIDKISTSGTINIFDSDNNEISSEGIIKTGDKITITFGQTTADYILVVLGDLNGDGKIKIGDVALLYQVQKSRIEPEPIVSYAGDLNGDGKIKIGDVALLYQIQRSRE